MAIYPGAVFKPTNFGGKIPRNKQGRGILHVAVSARRSYPPDSANTWHFYVAKAAPDGSTDGSGGPAYCEQYVDTEFRAATSAAANDDAIGIETAGGLGSSAVLNAEKWTRAQELRLADIMRWESQQPGGAPLELLPDARPGRRGWGPHRLGIKHSGGPRPGWWQPGSELWSSHLGKECPGDAKVAQIPQIIQMARTGQTQEDDMSAEAERMIAEIHGKLIGSRLDYRYHHGRPEDDMFGSLLSVRLGLDQLLPEVPNVRKAGDVFQAIWHIKQTVEALTATVADMVGKGSGDLTEERFRELLAESVVQVDIDVRGGTATGPVS